MCLMSVLCGSEIHPWGKIPSCQLLEVYGPSLTRPTEHIGRRLVLSVRFFVYQGPFGRGTLLVEVGGNARLFPCPVWSYALTEYSPRFKELLNTHMQNKKLKPLPNSSPTVQISWYHFRIHCFTDLSCIHMWHVCYSRAVHRQCRIISGVTIHGFSNSKHHSVLPRTRTLLTLLTFPQPP